jgi:hypothetical protein
VLLFNAFGLKAATGSAMAGNAPYLPVFLKFYDPTGSLFLSSFYGRAETSGAGAGFGSNSRWSGNSGR